MKQILFIKEYNIQIKSFLQKQCHIWIDHLVDTKLTNLNNLYLISCYPNNNEKSNLITMTTLLFPHERVNAWHWLAGHQLALRSQEVYAQWGDTWHWLAGHQLALGVKWFMPSEVTLDID